MADAPEAEPGHWIWLIAIETLIKNAGIAGLGAAGRACALKTTRAAVEPIAQMCRAIRNGTSGEREQGLKGGFLRSGNSSPE